MQCFASKHNKQLNKLTIKHNENCIIERFSPRERREKGY